MVRRLLVGTVMAYLIGLGLFCPASMAADLESRTTRIERQIEALQRELGEIRAEQEKRARDASQQMEQAAQREEKAREDLRASTLELLNRVKVGGYGSFRFESNSLGSVSNTFTLRRLVLTTDATISSRVHFYSELEFERFRKLELERPALEPSLGGVAARQAIEGTNQSEISLEQAYLQFELNDWLALRAGAMLVPLGRFNLHHDDNL